MTRTNTAEVVTDVRMSMYFDVGAGRISLCIRFGFREKFRIQNWTPWFLTAIRTRGRCMPSRCEWLVPLRLRCHADIQVSDRQADFTRESLEERSGLEIQIAAVNTSLK